MAPPPRIKVVHRKGWLAVFSSGDLTDNAFFTGHVAVGTIGITKDPAPQHRPPNISVKLHLLCVAAAFDFDS